MRNFYANLGYSFIVLPYCVAVFVPAEIIPLEVYYILGVNTIGVVFLTISELFPRRRKPPLKTKK